MKKTCPKCETPKELEEFNFKNKERTHRLSWCKACSRKRVGEYQKTPAGKARRRARSLRDLYNLSVDGYNLLLAAQGGKCAICPAEQAGRGRPFYVDHDHKTGVVRGLLCNSCNRALGLFRDSLEILCSATRYMEKHQ